MVIGTDPVESSLELLRATRKRLLLSREHVRDLRESLELTALVIEESQTLLQTGAGLPNRAYMADHQGRDKR